MTPERYKKILAVADDERAPAAMRVVAQQLVAKWKDKMEVPSTKGLHPGMRLSPEYEVWVKSLHIGKKSL